MIKSVFIIDKVEFLTTLIDLALMKNNIHTFTQSDIDCVHFIEDFNPTFMILDALTYSESDAQLKGKFQEKLRAYINKNNSTKILGMGVEDELTKLSDLNDLILGYVKKPITISSFYETLLSYYQ